MEFSDSLSSFWLFHFEPVVSTSLSFVDACSLSRGGRRLPARAEANTILAGEFLRSVPIWSLEYRVYGSKPPKGGTPSEFTTSTNPFGCPTNASRLAASGIRLGLPWPQVRDSVPAEGRDIPVRFPAVRHATRRRRARSSHRQFSPGFPAICKVREAISCWRP